jgi:hypothetical protein
MERLFCLCAPSVGDAAAFEPIPRAHYEAVCLEVCVKGLVPAATVKDAYAAAERTSGSVGTSFEERAALMLLLIGEWDEKSVCGVVNGLLKGRDRVRLKWWAAFLKLVVGGLEKLPRFDGEVAWCVGGRELGEGFVGSVGRRVVLKGFTLLRGSQDGGGDIPDVAGCLLTVTGGGGVDLSWIGSLWDGVVMVLPGTEVTVVSVGTWGGVGGVLARLKIESTHALAGWTTSPQRKLRCVEEPSDLIDVGGAAGIAWEHLQLGRGGGDCDAVCQMDVSGQANLFDGGGAHLMDGEESRLCLLLEGQMRLFGGGHPCADESRAIFEETGGGGINLLAACLQQDEQGAKRKRKVCG